MFTNYQNSAAGPECLVNYFQKVALLGKKVALNLWYFDTSPNSQKIKNKLSKQSLISQI